MSRNLVLTVTVLVVKSIPPLFAASTILSTTGNAEQRDFPTGEPGSVVTYLDAAGIGHPTDCVVGISAGLPKLALSMNVFSSNKTSLMVASQSILPPIAAGSDATVKVGSAYIFAKVTKLMDSGSFHAVLLDPVSEVGSDPVDVIYKAINEVVFMRTHIDFVADDAQVGSVVIPAEPGLADAFKACQQYMLSHRHP